jgi:hypothetical protein|tara:strand:- start:10785 stop:10961 length:177 start_codon:yes stop_codon:yes gene_type:complete
VDRARVGRAVAVVFVFVFVVRVVVLARRIASTRDSRGDATRTDAPRAKWVRLDDERCG